MSAVVVPDMNHPESGGGAAGGRMVGSPAYHPVIRVRYSLSAGTSPHLILSPQVPPSVGDRAGDPGRVGEGREDPGEGGPRVAD